MDRSQTVIGRNWGEWTALWCQIQNAQGKPGEGRQRKRDNRGEDIMRGRIDVVAALARVRFGWILNGLQVVGHRDDREQEQNEERVGDKLHSRGIDSPAPPFAWGKPQPEAENERAKPSPDEI